MSHDFEATPVLETLLTRLDEMRLVLGPQAVPRLGAVRTHLERAIARRADGDPPGAAAEIRVAMQALAELADALDPAEGTLMRAVVQMFGAALARGEPGEAERTADLMRERSGARKIERKD